MTKLQTNRVITLLQLFVKIGSQKKFVPKEFLLQLKIMSDMAERGLSFSPEELAILELVFELYFNVFDESDVDPLSEQAYAKITGYWPSDILDGPWYDRVIKYQDKVGYKPPKDAREVLGY